MPHEPARHFAPPKRILPRSRPHERPSCRVLHRLGTKSLGCVNLSLGREGPASARLPILDELYVLNDFERLDIPWGVAQAFERQLQLPAERAILPPDAA